MPAIAFCRDIEILIPRNRTQEGYVMTVIKKHPNNKALTRDAVVTPKVRFSEGLRRDLRREADKNFRTLNAEITARLTRSL